MTTKWRWITWASILTATVVAALYPVAPPAIPIKKKSHAVGIQAAGLRTLRAARAQPEQAHTAGHLPELNHDPFDPVAWNTPPPPPPTPPVIVPAVVTEPAAPVEPPLPYKYQGSMKQEDGSTVIFLSRGQEGILAHVGDVLDTNYKLVSMDESKLTILYVPMDHNHDIALDKH